MADDRLVILGEIVGVHGIRGWVKVHADTEPREKILEYGSWLLAAGDGTERWVCVLDGGRRGKGLAARLEGIEDRDGARELIGAIIQVRRDQLPPPGPGEYYWADLEGLRVVNADGVELGRVKRMFRTGANDVMVVAGDRERLVPFVPEQYVLDVDFERNEIRVDWDEAF